MKTDKLIKTLAKEAGKKAPLNPPLIRSAIWFLLVSVFAAFLLNMFGIRPDIADRIKEIFFVTELSILMLMAMVSGISSAYLSLPDANQQPAVIWAPWVIFISFIAFNIYGLVTIDIVSEIGVRYDCAREIVLFAVVPIIMIFYMMRKAAPTYLVTAGATAGLSVSSISYLVLRLVEQNDDIIHLMFWHFIPMLLLVLLCAGIGGIVLRRL